LKQAKARVYHFFPFRFTCDSFLEAP